MKLNDIVKTLFPYTCLAMVFSSPSVLAGPSGGQVVGGKAQIHQSGNQTTINQNSNRAIINWNTFDIGKNETVLHNMPSSGAAALHRVTGNKGASQIRGLLKSNGNIYVVNPAGIVLHKGTRVETNGFVASARDIADENFMSGKMIFDRPGKPDATIINLGSITVRENGLAALVAPAVRNEGLITGKLGQVVLASGNSTWKLDLHGDDLIAFVVDEKSVDQLYDANGNLLGENHAINAGTIKADGGVVILTAAQLDNIVGNVVNSGIISAASAEMEGGKIIFRGEGSNVSIVNSGRIDASSAQAEGGLVSMTAADIKLTENSHIDVSSNAKGGSVLIGGNWQGQGEMPHAQQVVMEKGALIQANANQSGDGGKVVLWSDGKTTFNGMIQAKAGEAGGNGGQVETSGHTLKVGDEAQVNTAATQGKTGEWLLDPVDFTIARKNGDITGAAISANLENNNVTIKSEQGKTGSNGDININDKLKWASETTLTLEAERDININADIIATGNNAGLELFYSGDYYLNQANITLSGTNPYIKISGKTYRVVNTLKELQNINEDTTKNYALGTDIDASETKNWNDGAGFVPIGNFRGNFAGFGHTIDSLTIKLNQSNVGFFSNISKSAYARDFGLENVNIEGGHNCTGAIAGVNEGHIYNTYITGKIKGNHHSAGLVGVNHGNISHSFAVASVNGGMFCGGFVGENYGTIYSSWFKGNLSSAHRSGGFAGTGSGEISNSYAITNGVSSLGSGFSSGGKFINNYAITDIEYMGWWESGDGFSSNDVREGSYGNYWYSSFVPNGGFGSNYSRYGTKLTPSQMMQESSFKGWDFENIWSIDEGVDYPRLRKVATFIKTSTDPEPEPEIPPELPLPIPDPNPNLPTNPDIQLTPGTQDVTEITLPLIQVDKTAEQLLKKLEEINVLDKSLKEVIDSQLKKDYPNYLMSQTDKLVIYQNVYVPALNEFADEILEAEEQYIKKKIAEKALEETVKLGLRLAFDIATGQPMDVIILLSQMGEATFKIIKDNQIVEWFIKKMFIQQCIENYRKNYEMARAIIAAHPEGLDHQRALRVSQLYKNGALHLALAKYYANDAIKYVTESEFQLPGFEIITKETLGHLKKTDDNFKAELINTAIKKLSKLGIKSDHYVTSTEAKDIVSGVEQGMQFKKDVEDMKKDVKNAFNFIKMVSNAAENPMALIEALMPSGINGIYNEVKYVYKGIESMQKDETVNYMKEIINNLHGKSNNNTIKESFVAVIMEPLEGIKAEEISGNTEQFGHLLP